MTDISNAAPSPGVPHRARPVAATLAEVMDQIRDVEGWMTPGQAATLYDGARRCPRGSQIVEIGSFRGRSTIVLASGADPSVRVVAIDPHAGNDRGPNEIVGFVDAANDDHDVFLRNLADTGVRDRVLHLRMSSDEALTSVDGDLGLLYIDGAHRFAPARRDIASWGRRVTDGGTMLIHDSFSSVGVTLAIGRELLTGSRFRYVGRSRSLAIYRADLAGTPGARISNTLRQLAQLPWFTKNLALKVLLSVGLARLMTATGRSVPDWPY